VVTKRAARAIGAFGGAVSFLVLLAVHPGAMAGPILAEQSAAAPASEFDLSRIKTAESWYWDEESAADTLMFDIGSADMVDGSGLDEDARRFAALIARLGLNSSTRVSSGPGTNNDAYALEHDVAAAAYYTIFSMNQDVALDLLALNGAMNRISVAINSALAGPLNAVGLTNGSIITNMYEVPTEGGSNNNGYYRIPLDFFIKWIRFLLSEDAVPYYIMISTVLIIGVTFHILLRRR
jgi:hypothetical protein